MRGWTAVARRLSTMALARSGKKVSRPLRPGTGPSGASHDRRQTFISPKILIGSERIDGREGVRPIEESDSPRTVRLD